MERLVSNWLIFGDRCTVKHLKWSFQRHISGQLFNLKSSYSDNYLKVGNFRRTSFWDIYQFWLITGKLMQGKFSF